MIPQILHILLVGLGLGVELSKHGKPREGKYHFGTSLLVTLLILSLLYWGGFYDVFSGGDE